MHAGTPSPSGFMRLIVLAKHRSRCRALKNDCPSAIPLTHDKITVTFLNQLHESSLNSAPFFSLFFYDLFPRYHKTILAIYFEQKIKTSV
ncbi:hypothetical protein [Pseudoramibacter alactolyticus]|uniref:hypothetical protein n=1 Tax=Pseudoramibacter alactolyticus TaxID=113287 RepID=UPI0023550571|nr:hypothetical protein [Pseudoramibacter alactolyticus]MBM6968202.1 hypothetical protein [Pseudoramibacter alactolyticus]